MPDWKSKDSYERLLASLIAAHPGLKLDYRKMATYFGSGATYDSIEGRFRPIRKSAQQMKDEAETGALPEAPQRGSASANTTPRKPKAQKSSGQSHDGVLNGRVSKYSNASPTKRKQATQMKKDMLESSTSSSYSGDASSPNDEPNNLDTSSFAYDPSLMSFEMIDGASLGANQMSMVLPDDDFWDNQHAI